MYREGLVTCYLSPPSPTNPNNLAQDELRGAPLDWRHSFIVAYSALPTPGVPPSPAPPPGGEGGAAAAGGAVSVPSAGECAAVAGGGAGQDVHGGGAVAGGGGVAVEGGTGGGLGLDSSPSTGLDGPPSTAAEARAVRNALVQHTDDSEVCFPFSYLLLSSLELSDTNVYEP